MQDYRLFVVTQRQEENFTALLATAANICIYEIFIKPLQCEL